MTPKTPVHSLLPEYFEAHFEREEPWEDWPPKFAIITAHATTGEQWPPTQNAQADRELEAALRRQCRWVRRLTGYSPATGHAEPGWAADLPFDAACDLGQRFRQHAIYFVAADLLQVSHCDHRRRQVPVGPFRQRVHLKGFGP